MFHCKDAPVAPCLHRSRNRPETHRPDRLGGEIPERSHAAVRISLGVNLREEAGPARAHASLRPFVVPAPRRSWSRLPPLRGFALRTARVVNLSDRRNIERARLASGIAQLWLPFLSSGAKTAVAAVYDRRKLRSETGFIRVIDAVL